jgi:hypothetical protein
MKSVTVVVVHKPFDSSHGHVPIHLGHKAGNITISRQLLIQKYPKQELVLERQELVRGLVGCTEGGVVASRPPASVALGVKVPVTTQADHTTRLASPANRRDMFIGATMRAMRHVAKDVLWQVDT